MKLRSKRGPSWDEASERVTNVIEKTTPATVIIDPAMIPSTALAPSAPPVNVQPRLSVNQRVTDVSTVTLTNANATATTVMSVGMNQKLDRTRFQNLNNSPFTLMAPQSLVCDTQPNARIHAPALLIACN